VTIEEIRERLDRALPLRVPQRDPNKSTGELVSELTDHLLTCAYHRAELEEALHWAVELGKALKRDWDNIQGWQATVGRKATQAQIDGAKRDINAGLWDALEEARTLVESLRRQITRLGGSDYDAVSRAYTLLSGA
jgi:hypothetical protein